MERLRDKGHNDKYKGDNMHEEPRGQVHNGYPCKWCSKGIALTLEGPVGEVLTMDRLLRRGALSMITAYFADKEVNQ